MVELVVAIHRMWFRLPLTAPIFILKIKMRYLKQRYKSDCFPTCLAMVANISYKEALKIVHPNRKKWKSYGTNLIFKLKALKKLGIDYNLKLHTQKLCNIPNLSIIRIQWKTGNKYYHVVVWDPINKKIYDPAHKKSLPHSLYEKNMDFYIEIYI